MGTGGAYHGDDLLSTCTDEDEMKPGFEPFMENYEGPIPFAECDEPTRKHMAQFYITGWWVETKGLVRNLWKLLRRKR